MKYLIVILSLVFFSSASTAAIVSFSSLDNKNGTAMVTWNGTDVLGMALDVTVKRGLISDVSFSGFNIILDDSLAQHPGSELSIGQSSYPGSFSIGAGYLSPGRHGLSDGTITFTVSKTAVFVISANDNRGGVIDLSGSSLVQGFPLTVTATVPEPMIISLTTLGGLLITRRRA